jgi:nucleoside-diphosphate-sugar epimerase
MRHGKHAFIIGGTGQIGRAAAATLLSHGWRVTLTSRGVRPLPASNAPALRGAAHITLDRDEPGALPGALARTGGADAIIDTIAYTETHAQQLLGIEHDTGALIVISTASVYRDDAGRSLDEAQQKGFPIFPEPIRESQPTVGPGAKSYPARKVAIERRLLDHARRPVIILRPGAIHGPFSQHPREWWFVKRVLDGRRVIPLADCGRNRFHTTAAANIGTLIETLLSTPAKPVTQILNIADPSAPTVAEIGACITKHLRYRGTLLPIETTAGCDIGQTPWTTPHPLVLDTRAAEALGYRPATTCENAIPATCDWLITQNAPGSDWKTKFPVLASYPADLFDYAAEDRFLSQLQT